MSSSDVCRLDVPHPGRRPAVLLVEDNDVLRRLYRLTLERRSFRVVEAVNGLQALRRLDENPDVGLVITDVDMPVMNGLDFIRSVRGDARRSDLPIVVQTSEPDGVGAADRAALGIPLVLEKEAFREWLRTLSGLPAPSRSEPSSSNPLPLRLLEPSQERSVEVRIRHGARPRVVHVTLTASDAPAGGAWCFRVSFDPRRLLFVLAEGGAEATPHGTANRDGVVRVRNLDDDGAVLRSARLQFFELQPFERTSFEASIASSAT